MSDRYRTTRYHELLHANSPMTFFMQLVLALLLLTLPTAGYGESALRVGVFSLPRGLGNPHSSTAISEMHTWAALFDSLTKVDGEANVLPALATDWRAVNPTTWHFELRRGVSFSNGERFNAKAVVAVIDYFLSPEGRGLSVARELAAIKKASPISDYLVEIRTHEPTLILPALLAGMRIVAPEHWQQLGSKGFAREPIGTGPFQLVSWSAARVTLVSFKQSWRPPRVDRLELYEIAEPAARLQGLQSGGLDVALAISADDMAQLERTGGKGHASVGGAVTSLSFITVKPGPLRDRRVRRALNYAIDKQAIVDVLFRGLTRATGQPTPHYAHGHNPKLQPYPFDPRAAHNLLAEAGYPDGFKLVAEVAPSGPHTSPELIGFLRQQLADVGVDLEVRALPTAQMIQNAITGNFSGTAFSMTFDAKPYLDGQRSIGMHSCLRTVPWHCDESVMPMI